MIVSGFGFCGALENPVVGGLAEGSRDVDASRAHILRGLEALMPATAATGIAIAQEPLHPSIAGAGPRIRAFQVCDWLWHTQEPLLDRGMIGDGVIDLKRLRAMVEATGFDGPVEVEIFSRDRWWKEDADVVRRTCRERLQTVC